MSSQAGRGVARGGSRTLKDWQLSVTRSNDTLCWTTGWFQLPSAIVNGSSSVLLNPHESTQVGERSGIDQLKEDPQLRLDRTRGRRVSGSDHTDNPGVVGPGNRRSELDRGLAPAIELTQEAAIGFIQISATDSSEPCPSRRRSRLRSRRVRLDANALKGNRALIHGHRGTVSG